jgi:hypothetical protein
LTKQAWLINFDIDIYCAAYRIRIVGGLKVAFEVGAGDNNADGEAAIESETSPKDSRHELMQVHCQYCPSLAAVTKSY